MKHVNLLLATLLVLQFSTLAQAESVSMLVFGAEPVGPLNTNSQPPSVIMGGTIPLDSVDKHSSGSEQVALVYLDMTTVGVTESDFDKVSRLFERFVPVWVKLDTGNLAHVRKVAALFGAAGNSGSTLVHKRN